MIEPLAAVMRSRHVARGACDATQCPTGAWGKAANPFLYERPRCFNRVEVIRVWRQETEASADPRQEPTHAGVLMRTQIVEHDDIAGPQLGDERAAHPGDERRGRRGAPLRPQGDPAASAYRANQREVLPPVHRPRLDVFGAPFDPDVRSAHREIRARFIEKHQPVWLDAPAPSYERCPLPADVGPIDFARPRPFFLTTYPARRSARHRLVGVVWWARATRRLYAQHSSAQVASGASASTASSAATSMGDRQPPPFGRAVRSPLRQRATHRCSVRVPTPKRSATSSCVPRPASYARTARARSRSSSGFGMLTVKYKPAAHSSAKWG
jgi:hypothetical protein